MIELEVDGRLPDPAARDRAAGRAGARAAAADGARRGHRLGRDRAGGRRRAARLRGRRHRHLAGGALDGRPRQRRAARARRPRPLRARVAARGRSAPSTCCSPTSPTCASGEWPDLAAGDHRATSRAEALVAGEDGLGADPRRCSAALGRRAAGGGAGCGRASGSRSGPGRRRPSRRCSRAPASADRGPAAISPGSNAAWSGGERCGVSVDGRRRPIRRGGAGGARADDRRRRRRAVPGRRALRTRLRPAAGGGDRAHPRDQGPRRRQALRRPLLQPAGDARAPRLARARGPARPSAALLPGPGDRGRRQPRAALPARLPRGSRAARPAADRGSAGGRDVPDLPDQRQPLSGEPAAGLASRPSIRRSPRRSISRSTAASSAACPRRSSISPALERGAGWSILREALIARVRASRAGWTAGAASDRLGRLGRRIVQPLGRQRSGAVVGVDHDPGADRGEDDRRRRRPTRPSCRGRRRPSRSASPARAAARSRGSRYGAPGGRPSPRAAAARSGVPQVVLVALSVLVAHRSSSGSSVPVARQAYGAPWRPPGPRAEPRK